MPNTTPYYQRVLPVERVLGGKVSGVASYSAQNVAPHANTTRWSYTVPTSRAAIVESALALVMRFAAAGPAAFAFAVVFVPATNALIVYAQELQNAIGLMSTSQIGEAGALFAGDIATAVTADASVGGTYNYAAAMRYREIIV